MKKCTFLLLAAALLYTVNANAQRYLNQVFTQASKTTVIYGANYTVLSIATTGHTAKQPLVMDVYQPDGDTEQARPLILYFHTGNFLPWINPATMLSVNQACGGTRSDPAAVEICTRLAKMGYVVASVDYRLGWRPDLLEELNRRFTLINAAYRGVQDARTCIRYFRKTVAEAGNPYKIDPNRIVLMGQGTGGYISLNTAALDKYSEIITTSEPGKFVVNGIPMIIELYNGDPYGVQAAAGVVDAAYAQGTGYKVGDTLYIQNHPGYSSDFKLSVNFGGALGDKNWLDANTPPTLSFHVPLDPYAPCGDGLVIVPGVNFPVVNVTGSCGVAPLQDQLGNNDVFKVGGLLTDPLSVAARSINGGTESYYPFFRPKNDSAPWEWNTFVPKTVLPTGDTVLLNCSTNQVTAFTAIDTIIAYYAPRACRALGLECPGVSVKAEELFDASTLLTIAPNPAQTEVWFRTDADHPIQAIELYDMGGRQIRSIHEINQGSYAMPRKGLANGMYVAKLYFAEGVTARRIMFR